MTWWGCEARIASPSGVAHFRMVWELGGWASQVGKSHIDEARASGIASFKAGTSISLPRRP